MSHPQISRNIGLAKYSFGVFPMLLKLDTYLGSNARVHVKYLYNLICIQISAALSICHTQICKPPKKINSIYVNQVGILHILWNNNSCWHDIRADSRFAPNQWETVLLCNDVFHRLGASPVSALWYLTHCLIRYTQMLPMIFVPSSISLPWKHIWWYKVWTFR